MSKCGQPPASGQRRLTAPSTAVLYEWFTPWGLAMGLDNVKAAIKRRGTGATFQSQLAIQVAQVRTDKPNAPTALGSMAADNGETCTGVIDVTQYTAGNYFARLGIAYSLTAGQSVAAQADVTLDVSNDGCGYAVGSTSAQLQAFGPGNSYLAVSGWLSTQQAAEFKMAVVCTSLVGNFQWRPAFRVATTSTQDPAPWSTAFDQWRTAGEFCTGELTPANLGGEMWIQFGIQYNLSSGSTLGQASIQIVTSAKKA